MMTAKEAYEKSKICGEMLIEKGIEGVIEFAKSKFIEDEINNSIEHGLFRAKIEYFEVCPELSEYPPCRNAFVEEMTKLGYSLFFDDSGWSKNYNFIISWCDNDE